MMYEFMGQRAQILRQESNVRLKVDAALKISKSELFGP